MLRVALPVLVAAGLTVGNPGPASAQKVANPGSVTFTVQTGEFQVRDESFSFDQDRDPMCSDGSNNDSDQDSAVDFPADPQCTSASDDSEVAGGFQPMTPVTLAGTIDGAGNVNVPASGIVFPPQYIWVDGVVTVRIQPLSAATGTLNPLNGAANLAISIRVKLEGSPQGISLGSSCFITPININPLTTGTSGAVSGTPYNPATGRVTVANGTFSVPGASGCGTFGIANGPINDALGLPSPSGQNTAVLGLQTSPIIAPAVTANLTASPSTSGQAPFAVTFNGAGSTASAGIANYRFDFTNDGSFDETVTPPTTTASFTYTSPGTYTARVRVTDNQGDFAEKTLPIVVSTNQPPTANSQAVDTDEDGSVAITLTGSDPAGDPLTYSVVSGSGPAHGDLTGTPPALTYTPDANFHGSDSFQFRVQDPAGNTSSPATVAINVASVNDSPTVEGATVGTPEDTPVDFTVTASDVDGDTLFFSTSDGPALGTLSGTGPAFTYTPSQDVNGSDAFTVTVNDGHGGTASATVNVEITPVNDPPVADDQSVSTAQDTPVDFTLDVTDVDGPALNYTITGSPQHGTITGTAPNLTYTPDAGYFGPDSLSYAVSDGAGGSDTATVNISVVQPGNEPPVANDQTVNTDEDTPVAFTLDASDPNGDELTVTIVSGPSNGTLSGSGLTRTYTPDSPFPGSSDSFQYSVDDGRGGIDAATVTINVAAVNDAPVASAQTVTTSEDAPVGVTLNATDPDGEDLSFVVSGPDHGSLSGTAPDLVYTPDDNFNGLDSFTYEACDASDACVSSGVSIVVESVPDAPQAHDQAITTPEDTPVEINLDATDADGDELTITFTEEPQRGVLSGTGLDRRYTPSADVNGSDSFTYEACDPSDACDSATVSISVLGVNDVPTTQDQSVLTAEDNAVGVTLTAGDVDGDELEYTVQAPAHGTLSGTAPALIYSPNANFNGNDAFAYVVDDGNGGLASATVHIGVFSVQDAPVAQAQSVTTSEDIQVPVVLVATDGDGDPLQYFVEVGPAHGSLGGSAPNLTYTPFAGYNGPDFLEFSARDSTGRSDRATVAITVTAVDGIVTTLTAKPAQVGTVPPRIVKPLEARLTRTSTGTPLAGKRIEFYVGTTRRCVVTTDLNGTARCRPSPQSIGTASSYEARFLGDNDYAPSSATGTISRVV